MHMCKLCGDISDSWDNLKTHMEQEHLAEFDAWLQEYYVDEFLDWARDKYWDEFLTLKIGSNTFDNWVEDNSTEVELPE